MAKPKVANMGKLRQSAIAACKSKGVTFEKNPKNTVLARTLIELFGNLLDASDRNSGEIIRDTVALIRNSKSLRNLIPKVPRDKPKVTSYKAPSVSIKYTPKEVKENPEYEFYLSKEFLKSDIWFRLRYEALRLADGKCQCCGRGKHDGVVLHVDHIKPRSLFPWLATDINNLQVLCSECNIGKGNVYSDDWRK